MPSDKKVALVTGATRGIGFETARQLGQKDVVVVVGGRTQQDATSAANKLVAEGIEAYPVAIDITRDADRKAAAGFIAEKFGKLDILINNAGVGGEGGPSERSHNRDHAGRARIRLQYESLLRRRDNARAPATAQEEPGWPHRKPGQHRGFTNTARRCRRARLLHSRRSRTTPRRRP